MLYPAGIIIVECFGKTIRESIDCVLWAEPFATLAPHFIRCSAGEHPVDAEDGGLSVIHESTC